MHADFSTSVPRFTPLACACFYSPSHFLCLSLSLSVARLYCPHSHLAPRMH